ncbi:hypothetical protein Tco_0429833 [Tanacetum coccineum]
MDDEPMWAADRVVAPTPGPAITIPETVNEFAIKEMLRNCHDHNLTKGNIIIILYHGLNETTQEALDAAAGSIFLYKTQNQVFQLLEDKVLLKLDWAKNQKPKTSLKKIVAFTDEGNNNSDTKKIMARMDVMTMKMDAQYKEIQSHAKCNHCRGNHSTADCNDDDTPMSREEKEKFMQTFRLEYGVSNSTEYGVSISLSNTAYSSQQINTAYPLPLDTAYRSSGTKNKIIDFRAKFFLPSFGTNPTDCLSFVSVARPKIDNKDQFELKGQFLKELRENTFSGSDNEDSNEHIEKVLEIVDLFHVPNITVDQLMLRVFPISLTRAASHWLRNEPTGSIKTWEDLKIKFLNKYCPPSRIAKKMEEINNFRQEPDETLYQAWERFKELLMKCPQHYLTEMQEVILFYNGLDVPTRQILDSRGVIPTKTAVDAKTAIQEMVEYSQKWHNGTSRGRSIETSDGLAAIQAQLNNLGREIKKVNEKVYAAQVGCEQCKGPHYTKDCPQKEEGKALKEAYYTQFGGPFQGGGYRATAPWYYQRNNANPSFQERRQSMEDTLSKFMSESAKRHEENSNLIKEIRALTDATIRNQGASIKTLEIQIGQMSKLIQTRYAVLDQTNSSYPLDIRLLYKSRQTTVPFPSRLDNHYYEEEKNYGPKFTEAYGASHINNAIPRKEKDPVRLGESAHTRLTVELADRTVKYPKGIAENVLVGIGKFTFPIDFIILDMPEDVKYLDPGRSFLFYAVARLSLDPFSEDYIELNDLNEPFELRRNQGDDLMPTIEEVLEDNEMGDIIFGEPFLREVGIKTKRFEGIITLYNGDNEVTYQMVRSHPKFKHHTNEQCNKIPPLLKIYIKWYQSQVHLINSQISKSWFIPKIVVQKDLSKSVTAQSLPKNEKDQFLKRIASLESKLASQDIHSCQKEYHELRTSYNDLKGKFDALNQKKWNINVSKSSKPKESVSEKVHTGEFSKSFLRRVSQFTTYSLQKDRKFSKNSQNFETFFPQKGFKTRASNEKNQSFATSHSCFTPVKQVWRPKQSHSKSFKYSKSEMLSMQNKNDYASTIHKKGGFSNNAKTNFWNVSSNDNNKWKSSSSTRFKNSHETPSFKNQWKIKSNFKYSLIPQELFSTETPVSSSRWNLTSLHRLDTNFNWFSKFGKPVSTVLK